MKKIVTLSSLLLALPLVGVTQTGTPDDVQPEVTWDYPTKFFKTLPLRDILKGMPIIDETNYAYEAPKVRRWKPDTTKIVDIGIPENNHMDPARQSEMGVKEGFGMKSNWQGLSGSSFPPDPTGAAGPDHFVQARNSSYRVYNKDGSTAGPSVSLNTFFSEPDGSGDPIVMYDRFADRWFISQFTDPFATPYRILIAVSETSDPLGAYYFYEYTFTQFPDYPKFSVWSNAYFMTANTNPSNNDCIAFEREAMLLGDPSAMKINLTFPNFYQFFHSIAPAYAEGPTEPDADEPGYFFAVQDNSWSGAGISTDHIKVLKATLDWVTPSNSSVVNHQTLNTAAFNSTFTSSWDDIDQMGTTAKLDAVTGIFMYRVQYRRFEGYNVVMLCHTVDVDNTNRAGVRWYELRDNNDGQWYIYQQSTYSPDSDNNRWMGGIAMDHQGSIALAYCFNGPSDAPGIRYTGRYANDPLDQMTVQEQIAIDGNGYQDATNRYGDYSQMTMDPSDDQTFWFTGEYMGGNNSPRTRIFSFTSWNLAGVENDPINVPFFNAYQPSPEVVRIIWNDILDNEVTATLVDMNGKLIASQKILTSEAQMDIDVSSVASGIYVVNFTGPQTKLSQKIYLAQ